MPRNVGYKRPRRNIKNNRKNRKKPVKRKNPYRARNKRAMAKQIQPIAEGRKLGFINTTSPKYLAEVVGLENWQVIIPETWRQMYRENFLETLPGQPASQGFTGKTLFSRYLNQQIKIRFTNIKHNSIPCSFHVVYGWCKVPYITALQSQGSDSSTNPNNVLIQHDPSTMIQRLLSKMYSVTFPTTDPKQFKLMYNREFQVRGETITTTSTTQQGQVVTSQCVRKDIDYRITWRPNTKYHMRPATKGDGSDGKPPPDNDLKPDDAYVAYQNTGIPSTTAYWTPSSKTNGDLWIPFFAVQLKNAGDYGLIKQVV